MCVFVCVCVCVCVCVRESVCKRTGACVCDFSVSVLRRVRIYEYCNMVHAPAQELRRFHITGAHIAAIVSLCLHMHRVGQTHIYIRCIYGIFGREFTKYTVIYGVYIQFWPTLVIYGGTIVDGSYVFEMWVW